MNGQRIRERFMPWAGLALGTLGGGFAHQLGAASTFQDCRIGSPLVVVIGAIIGLVLVALGALASWRIYANDSETAARRMVAVVSLMACGIFAIATVLPFIASMLIPRCWA